MPAPLVGAAAIAAARLIASKLAKDAAKKVVKNSVKKSVKVAKKAKPLAEPKSAVKVVSPNPPGLRKAMNDYSQAKIARIGSGKAAKVAATSKAQGIKIAKEKARIADKKEAERILARGGRVVQMPKKTIKISSGSLSVGKKTTKVAPKKAEMPKGLTMAKELEWLIANAPKATKNVKPIPGNTAPGAEKLRRLMNGPKRSK